MAKAASGSITASTPRANGTIDLSDMMELIRRDWIEPGKARITLRSSSGQIYTVTTAMLVQSVNMAVELINTNVFLVLTDVTASERIAPRGNHRQGRTRFAPPSLLAESIQ